MPPIDVHKIVVFSGAGISAESGIKTFRDKDGLWNNLDPMKFASVEAWRDTPQNVIEFHNQRLEQIKNAQPNPAHIAIAELDKHFNVIVITQNVDDLHERGGSSNVFHVHGSVTEVYPDGKPEHILHRGYEPIRFGDQVLGRQLRPNIVLFGENIYHHEVALEHIETAGRILVVGTSLSVFPAAGMIKAARFQAEKIIVNLEVDNKPFGFQILRDKAGARVPQIANRWISEGPRKLS